MKVLKSYLKQGNKIVVCPVCRSVLEIDKSDIFSKYIDEDTDNSIEYIVCPVCKVAIDPDEYSI